ncbi:unnamed protein product [Kluyveromyces dobzhanskii CBS 2104]|uniref:WGS project CCBQ000000000 data, contig 00107 n=1 Tax=Kluyveromyces dobzhanskii CBS 2104 TaxID=1427455 RepID=A0A0A8KZ06_9SACH|nr:unnamed protein product [Kluyveromyces dobzhanskii CBS 2104]
MDLRYTFWSSVSTVSANSLRAAVAQDIQTIDQVAEFLSSLNSIWNSSLMSIKKIPAPRKVPFGKQVLEKITEHVSSCLVETRDVDLLRKRYESLLTLCNENKGRDMTLIKALKQWRTLKSEIQNQLAVLNQREETPCSMGGGIIRFSDKNVLFQFLKWIKDDIVYSKRFIPISNLQNEYFSGDQLIDSIRKRYPDCVLSLYQQEQLGQWFLSEGYMIHYNDILGVRKTFSCKGYYCWQDTDQHKSIKYNPATVNGMLWDQWSQYAMEKLHFETAHLNQMVQLAQLREDLVRMLRHYQDIMMANKWVIGTEAVPNVTVQSLYENNLGSVGFYTTLNEPIIKYNQETMRFQTVGPFPDDINTIESLENTIFWKLLEEIESTTTTTTAQDVKDCWLSEFDLIGWHRLQGDVLRRWMQKGACDDEYLSGLELAKKMILLKGWLIGLNESVVPSEICEECIRNNTDIFTSFQRVAANLQHSEIRTKCIARLLRHFIWLGPNLQEIMSAKQPRIPVAHFFMRCQHQLPSKAHSFGTLLVQEAQETRAEKWETLQRSDRAPLLVPAAAHEVDTEATVLPKLTVPGHVTTDFVPKPFKASAADSGTNMNTGIGMDSSTALLKEKRRSGTPLLQILPESSASSASVDSQQHTNEREQGFSG